mmetsp:Transcript_22933/g.39241  ORF Transcript_22933/g.39241 Transcript_22933/m.39241 type:complete len:199 (+) Transcript_22933:81-677(+)
MHIHTAKPKVKVFSSSKKPTMPINRLPMIPLLLDQELFGTTDETTLTTKVDGRINPDRMKFKIQLKPRKRAVRQEVSLTSHYSKLVRDERVSPFLPTTSLCLAKKSSCFLTPLSNHALRNKNKSSLEFPSLSFAIESTTRGDRRPPVITLKPKIRTRAQRPRQPGTIINEANNVTISSAECSALLQALHLTPRTPLSN